MLSSSERLWDCLSVCIYACLFLGKSIVSNAAEIFGNWIFCHSYIGRENCEVLMWRFCLHSIAVYDCRAMRWEISRRGKSMTMSLRTYFRGVWLSSILWKGVKWLLHLRVKGRRYLFVPFRGQVQGSLQTCIQRILCNSLSLLFFFLHSFSPMDHTLISHTVPFVFVGSLILVVHFQNNLIQIVNLWWNSADQCLLGMWWCWRILKIQKQS